MGSLLQWDSLQLEGTISLIEKFYAIKLWKLINDWTYEEIKTLEWLLSLVGTLREVEARQAQ